MTEKVTKKNEIPNIELYTLTPLLHGALFVAPHAHLPIPKAPNDAPPADASILRSAK